jgi:two-component system aerobic respiration control sensor histidine kinase ArcB
MNTPMNGEPEVTEQTESNVTILLIDDLEPLLLILEKGLNSAGHKVHTALSGSQAMAIFEKDPIDIVICDLGMEGMNGWDVSKAVQQACEKKGIPKTPFILLTGWGEDVGEDVRDKEDLARLGVDRLVEKPADILQLLDIIDELAASARSGGR